MKTREERIAEIINRVVNLTDEQFEKLLAHPEIIEMMNDVKKG